MHATFFVNVSLGCSFFESKLKGVSKGIEPVKAEISEAPTVLSLALTQSKLPCVPVSLEVKNTLHSKTTRLASVKFAI